MSLNEDQWQEIDEAFELFETDKHNSLNLHQLIRAMRALGFDFSREVLIKELNSRNINPNHVQFQQFRSFMSELIGCRDVSSELKTAFKSMDKNNSGKITLQKLKNIAWELGQVVSEKEMRAMIKKFDVDADGQINLQEFLSIFSEAS